MQLRLNKFLSKAGITSRREADKMIAEGRVQVNGEVIQILGYKIDDEKDCVDLDGKRVKSDKGLTYLLLNKPSGYLVTLKDPFKRPTIMSLLPQMKRRIFPVGRLDFDSEGLLLLTNNGELAYRLMHPRYKVRKEYLLTVKGKPDPSSLSSIKKGIYLDGKKTAPAKITQIASSQKRSHLRVEIYEGRKRELRRMFEATGYRVMKLKRIKFAGLTLGKLKKGEWRYLTRKEIDLLRRKVGLG